MEFCKICPRCLKTYTNGAIRICGYCKIKLTKIKFIRVEPTDTDLYNIVYQVEKEVQN